MAGRECLLYAQKAELILFEASFLVSVTTKALTLLTKLFNEKCKHS